MAIPPVNGPSPYSHKHEFATAPVCPKDTLVGSSPTSDTSFFESIIDAIKGFFQWIFCCGETHPGPEGFPPPPLKTEFETFVGILGDPRLALFNRVTRYNDWPLDPINALNTIILEDPRAAIEDHKGESLLHKLCRCEGMWGFEPFQAFQITHSMIAHLVNEKKADSAILDTQRRTPLHFVQTAETVKFFEGKVDFNSADQHGNTPLFSACSIEVATALMEGGADATLVNAAGQSPLHLTTNPDLCRFFIDTCSLKLDLEDDEGMTPMHRARTAEIATVIYGSNQDTLKTPSVKTGNLPLHTACNEGLVDYFLDQYPAGLETPNKAGNTPLAEQLNQLSKLTEGLSSTHFQRAITKLIERGASLDIKVDGMPLLEFLLANFDDFTFKIVTQHHDKFKFDQCPKALEKLFDSIDLVRQQGPEVRGEHEEILYYQRGQIVFAQDDYFEAIDFLCKHGAPVVGTCSGHSLPEYCLTLGTEITEDPRSGSGPEEWQQMAFKLALYQKDEVFAGKILDLQGFNPPATIDGLAPKDYCDKNGLNTISEKFLV